MTPTVQRVQTRRVAGRCSSTAAQLRSCYARACALCREHQLTSLAFPALSTGAYRFPLQAATEIAMPPSTTPSRPTPCPPASCSVASPSPTPRCTGALLDR
ncbi:MAG: macro domain-containing protein [Nannocystaceae bacterium]